MLNMGCDIDRIIFKQNTNYSKGDAQRYKRIIFLLKIMPIIRMVIQFYLQPKNSLLDL